MNKTKRIFDNDFLDSLKKFHSHTAASVLLDHSPDGKFICPVCGNGAGSDGTGLDISSEGTMHCFRCDSSFNIFSAVAAKVGLTSRKDFPKVVSIVAQAAGLDIRYQDSKYSYSTPLKSSQSSLDSAYDLAIKNHQLKLHSLLDYQPPKPVQSPLPDILKRSKSMDYIFEHDNYNEMNEMANRVHQYLGSRGFYNNFEMGFLQDWKLRYDPTSNSIIIPHNDSYASFRTVSSSSKAKYANNLKNVPVAIFNSKALEQDLDFLFITEGAFDALSIIYSFQSANIDRASAIATCGAAQKSLWKEIFYKLHNSKNPPRVIVNYDNDEAGNKNSQILVEHLHYLGINAIDLKFPQGQDANYLFSHNFDNLVDRLQKAISISRKSPKQEPYIVPKPVAEPENPHTILLPDLPNTTGDLERLKQEIDIAKKNLPSSCSFDDIVYLCSSHLSDIEFSNLFAKCNDDFRFNLDIQKWMFYDGFKWVPLNDETLLINRWSKLITYASLVADYNYRFAIFNHKDKFVIKRLKGILDKMIVAKNYRKSKDIIKTSTSHNKFMIRDSQFDSDFYSINTLNGIYNFKSDTFRKRTVNDYFLSLVNANFNPEASCELWEQFILDVMPDPKVRTIIQMFAGSCLLGTAEDQAVFFLYGPGGTGKSTFVDSIKTVIGDLGKTIPSEALMVDGGNRNAENASPIFFDLRKARLAIASETSKYSKLDVAKLKNLTGGDSLKARPLYGNPIEFKPQFKLLICGNFPPKVEDTNDSGLRRRLRVIPFKHVPKQPKTNLREIFARDENKSAILGWLIEGAKLYLKAKSNGDNPFDLNHMPEVVTKANEEFYDQGSSVESFIKDTGFTLAVSSRCSEAVVHEHYVEYSKKNRLSRVEREQFKQYVIKFFMKLYRDYEGGLLEDEKYAKAQSVKLIQESPNAPAYFEGFTLNI